MTTCAHADGAKPDGVNVRDETTSAHAGHRSRGPAQPTPAARSARPPRLVRGILSGPARVAAYIAAIPVRLAGRVREPAIAEPWLLHPGDAPPTDGRLLLLFDGGCGICLHARDVFGALDWDHRLVFDRIARHDRGLLASVPAEERYDAWHVVMPDGARLDGAAGLAAAIDALPAGGLVASLMRRNTALSDASTGGLRPTAGGSAAAAG